MYLKAPSIERKALFQHWQSDEYPHVDIATLNYFKQVVDLDVLLKVLLHSHSEACSLALGGTRSGSEPMSCASTRLDNETLSKVFRMP